MERSADGEFHGAFGAAPLRRGDCSTHGVTMSRNDHLPPTVQVGWGDYLALRRLGANLRNLFGCQAKKRRHGADTHWYCFLHQTTAFTHDANGVGQHQCASSYKS
jgi:hypothetical protein